MTDVQPTMDLLGAIIDRHIEAGTTVRAEYRVVDADGCQVNDAQPTHMRALVVKRQLERLVPELGPFGVECRSVWVSCSEWEPR